MKTLVNKNNPQIRITVPEIDRVCLSTGVDAYNVFIVKQWPLNSLVFFDTDWTLVEEEPVDLEKAAEEYADKHGFRVPYDGSNNFYDDVDVKASLEGFIAGARWMAEQMKGGNK